MNYYELLDCQYGDKVDWCTTQSLTAKDCQSGTKLSDQCCGTCAKKFPPGSSPTSIIDNENKPTGGGSATCPEGDKATYCSEMKGSPKKCYQAHDVCCDTCEKLSSHVKGTTELIVLIQLFVVLIYCWLEVLGSTFGGALWPVYRYTHLLI